jgi:hypothetical protein
MVRTHCCPLLLNCTLPALLCLQVDVEGCELDVLQGMDASTWAITRQVVAEVTLRCTVLALFGLQVLHNSSCSLLAPCQPLNECDALFACRCMTWATGWRRCKRCWRGRASHCRRCSSRKAPLATGWSLPGEPAVAEANLPPAYFSGSCMHCSTQTND